MELENIINQNQKRKTHCTHCTHAFSQSEVNRKNKINDLKKNLNKSVIKLYIKEISYLFKR